MKILPTSVRQSLGAGLLLFAAMALCFANPLNAAHEGQPAFAAAQCSCFDGSANCFFDGNRCPSSGGRCGCASTSLQPSHEDEDAVTLQASICNTCHGMGQVLSTCVMCGGDGVSRTGHTCHGCGGSGLRYVFCWACGGDGRFVTPNSLPLPQTLVRHTGKSAEPVQTLATCGLKCIENCGAKCTKAHHHMGFHKCGNGHSF